MTHHHKPVTAYIGLGANLGNRAANIKSALGYLSLVNGVQVGPLSSLLENPAVGGPPDSPTFLNAVLRIETTLSPRELLVQLLAIETRMGRQRRQRWEPRVIDLDLLIHGDLVIDELGLTIPHPRLHERPFVLLPLAEISPTWSHPIFARSARQLLDELPPTP